MKVKITEKPSGKDPKASLSHGYTCDPKKKEPSTDADKDPKLYHETLVDKKKSAI